MWKAFWNFLTGRKACCCCHASTGTMKDLEGFVDYVARSLVDAPDQIRVSTEEKSDVTVIRIDCDKADIGKLVGRRGKTIMAIRSLVNGAAGRQHKRVTVEVAD